jgi:transposase-like protein
MSRQGKRVKSYNRYSESLKRKIAKSYLSGEASYGVLAEENGLRDKSVVKEFVKWYRRKLSQEPNYGSMVEEDANNENTLSEAALKQRVSELERRLKQEQLRCEMLETMIDIAEQRFELEIRKKSGTNQSNK